MILLSCNMELCTQIPICWDANQADALLRREKTGDGLWHQPCACVLPGRSHRCSALVFESEVG